MALNRFQLLGRLRGAVNKVKFLLSFNARRWILSSVIGSSSRQRRLSFKHQPSGSLDCTNEDYYDTAGSSSALSRHASLVTDRSNSRSPRSEMTRSTSDASSSDDVDARAEDFIANFYRHIQMERQVSLQVRYCGEKKAVGLKRTCSD